MNKDKQSVTCPKCAAKIDVSALLHSQIEAELRQNFAAQLEKQQTEFENQSKAEKAQLEQSLKARLAADSAAQIDAMRNELNEKSQQLQNFNKTKAEVERLQREKLELRETFEAESQAKINQLLIEERKKTEQLLRASLEADSQAQIRAMRDELNAKSEQLREFNKAKAEIERLQREKSELKDTLEAESEAKLNLRLREEKQKIESSLELKMREKDFELETMKRELQDVQRRAEQGSTQLQGEVQELAIEEWLRTEFPFDEVEEIKKGQRGADCIQIVHTRSRQNCGKIYYESKRTLEFGRDWIEKFKADMQAKNIHVGVLVTQAMPKDMERMGLKEGVWVCTFEEFKGLSAVLRQSIIDISNLEIAQENKGEKMAMLYDFLISNEFKTNIQAIVEGFVQMEDDLNKERRTMESLWKQREKQIRKVMSNTASLYGSIRGIAGNAIQVVPQLESTTPVIESNKPLTIPVASKKIDSGNHSLF